MLQGGAASHPGSLLLALAKAEVPHLGVEPLRLQSDQAVMPAAGPAGFPGCSGQQRLHLLTDMLAA